MKKFIADDLISFFHIVSALASTGDYIRKGDSVFLNVISPYCSRKSFHKKNTEFRGGNVNFNFSETKERLLFFDFINLVFKSFLFFISRLISVFYRVESRIFLIHHTYFKPSLLRYVSYKDIFFVTILSFEEGVGTYGGFFHHRATGVTEGKKFAGIKFVVRFFLKFFVSHKYKVLKSPKLHDVLSFQEAVGVIASFLGYEKVLKAKNYYEKDKKKKIIFVSSKLVDSGILNLQEYKSILEKIHHEFTEYKIYVKPHPTEKLSLLLYDELGFDILDKDLPGEYLVDCLRPELLVGFCSGLLLSANKIYECDYRIINISKISNTRNQKVDSSILNLFSKDKVINI